MINILYKERVIMTLLTVNPFDNVGLSALVAAVPIILFLLCLTVLK